MQRSTGRRLLRERTDVNPKKDEEDKAEAAGRSDDGPDAVENVEVSDDERCLHCSLSHEAVMRVKMVGVLQSWLVVREICDRGNLLLVE